MKKTLIIALLVALVLGVFTACNGEVAPSKKEETKKEITLEINSLIFGELSFTGGDNSKTFDVTGSESWEQLIDELTIGLTYDNDQSFEFSIKSDVDGYMYFETSTTIISLDLYVYSEASCTDPDERLKSGEELSNNTTYYLGYFI